MSENVSTEELLSWVATNPKLARQVIVGRGMVFHAGISLHSVLQTLKRTNERVARMGDTPPIDFAELQRRFMEGE